METKNFLRHYQEVAVDKMHNGCILNGGVGSGKSRTGLFYYFKENGGLMMPFFKKMENPQDLYIVTTAKKRDSKEWEGELANFAMSTDSDSSMYDNKIIVDSWNNIKKYVEVTDSFFIFDEDRVTGNGAWVKAFLKIAKKNNWIVLSATPGDTWSDYIPVFVANGFYKNKTEFKREHIVYSSYVNYPKIDRYLNTKRLVRLRNKILVNMDFNRPTVPHHIDVYCNYDIGRYKYVMRNRWDIFKDEPIEQASGLCYVLRRVVNSADDRHNKLFEIMRKHDKIILFYNFDYERDMIKYLIGELGQCTDDPPEELFDIAEWNGHAHEDIPDSKKWIYLVQYTAGCEGWNCIETNTIVFYSQNYSYKTMKQAAGRIDRLNTKFVDLYYYHFKSRSGIDLAISKALKEKKKFNEAKWCKFD